MKVIVEDADVKAFDRKYSQDQIENYNRVSRK
jgi:hypothetical protein